MPRRDGSLQNRRRRQDAIHAEPTAFHQAGGEFGRQPVPDDQGAV
jgi:hypothetical protein